LVFWIKVSCTLEKKDERDASKKEKNKSGTLGGFNEISIVDFSEELKAALSLSV
jgi:hypothetical protein